MYASTTDYSQLYNPAYRLKRGENVSFPQQFPGALKEFCLIHKRKYLLDISGGQGNLAKVLQDLGITVIVTDYEADHKKNILPLALSEYTPEIIKQIKQALNSKFQHNAYIST